MLGWLTRLTLVMSVFGVLAFDAFALTAGRFGAEDNAQAAARAASQAYRTPADLQRAYDAAYAVVAADGDRIEAPSFSITPEGRVTLVLRRTVPTLLVEKISPLRRWADIEAKVVATRPV